MTRPKSRTDPPLTLDATTLLPVRTPPINLHDLDAVRREMARVYRDMRTTKIDSQDGTRLIYALAQIGKLHESADLEHRVGELERITT